MALLRRMRRSARTWHSALCVTSPSVTRCRRQDFSWLVPPCRVPHHLQQAEGGDSDEAVQLVTWCFICMCVEKVVPHLVHAQVPHVLLCLARPALCIVRPQSGQVVTGGEPGEEPAECAEVAFVAGVTGVAGAAAAGVGAGGVEGAAGAPVQLLLCAFFRRWLWNTSPHFLHLLALPQDSTCFRRLLFLIMWPHLGQGASAQT